METLFVPLVVVAVVKLVDLIADGDYRSSLKIVLAGVVGAVAGFFHIQGLSISEGIQAGLTASGLVSIVKFMQDAK